MPREQSSGLIENLGKATVHSESLPREYTGRIVNRTRTGYLVEPDGWDGRCIQATRDEVTTGGEALAAQTMLTIMSSVIIKALKEKADA